MALKLADLAPDFEAETTKGKINFHDWLGNSWGLFFSHPEDYTPVCTTELGVVANLREEFTKRNVKIIALSIDDVKSHLNWIKDIEETIDSKVDFPIIADIDKSISAMYGMIHEGLNTNFTIRSVFIIGPDKKIRLTLTYPMAIGRNFDEILRVIDALQLSENYNVVTPANWILGEKVIIAPTLSEEEIAKEFPKGFDQVKPYLRYIPQPKGEG